MTAAATTAAAPTTTAAAAVTALCCKGHQHCTGSISELQGLWLGRHSPYLCKQQQQQQQQQHKDAM